MKVKTSIAALVCGLTFAAPVFAVENPPTGISPSEFARKYSGCLGPLRSTLAQGTGSGLFANGFGPGVNPGVHQGTVGEEEFLRAVVGIPASELAAFCAQFAK